MKRKLNDEFNNDTSVGGVVEGQENSKMARLNEEGNEKNANNKPSIETTNTEVSFSNNNTNNNNNNPIWMDWFLIELSQYISSKEFGRLSKLSKQFNEQVWFKIRNHYLLPTQRIMNLAILEFRFDLMILTYENNVQHKFDPFSIPNFLSQVKFATPKLTQKFLEDERFTLKTLEIMFAEFCSMKSVENVDLLLSSGKIDLNQKTNQDVIYRSFLDNPENLFPAFLKHEIIFSTIIPYWLWTKPKLTALFKVENFKIESMKDALFWWKIANSMQFLQATYNDCLVDVLLNEPKMNEWFKSDMFYEHPHPQTRICYHKHSKLFLNDDRINFMKIATSIFFHRLDNRDLIQHQRVSLEFHCWILCELLFEIDFDSIVTVKSANHLAECYVLTDIDQFQLKKDSKFSFEQLLNELRSQINKRRKSHVVKNENKMTDEHRFDVIFAIIEKERLVGLAQFLFNQEFLKAITTESYSPQLWLPKCAKTLIEKCNAIIPKLGWVTQIEECERLVRMAKKVINEIKD